MPRPLQLALPLMCAVLSGGALAAPSGPSAPRDAAQVTRVADASTAAVTGWCSAGTLGRLPVVSTWDLVAAKKTAGLHELQLRRKGDGVLLNVALSDKELMGARLRPGLVLVIEKKGSGDFVMKESLGEAIAVLKERAA